MFLDKAHRLMKVMTELGLFLLVWLIAGAAMFGIGTIAWELIRSKNDEVKVEAKVSDKKNGNSELTLKIGFIQKYDNLWVAKIDEPVDSYRVDYHASKDITRNLLITPDKSNKAHILFDSYKNKITELNPLPEMNNLKVIACKFIKNYNDTEDEGSSKLSLVLINKNADKQKTIVEDADKVLKVEMKDDKAINVIYFKEGKLISAIYSLDGFKTISAPAIFDLKHTDLKNSKLLIGAD